tara:strand:- start:5244 stop:6266 length:1023 start_codon:yes stop_codon:yes gene_type:complete
MSEEKKEIKYELFNINKHNIDMSSFQHQLHDVVEENLEKEFAEYVGAKHACIFNSASSIFSLIFMGITQNIPREFLSLYPLKLPSLIPVAMANVIHNSGMPSVWSDDVDWVGRSYVLYDTKMSLYRMDPKSKPFKVIDSAQEVRRNQFAEDAQDEDLMVFSLYPTKPVGGLDGGVLVSNDLEKINYFRTAGHLGVGAHKIADGSWERALLLPGWKMHPNAAQCYVALQNLKSLDEKYEKIDKIVAKYNDAFGLENKSRHLYRINVEERRDFMHKMRDLDIQTGIHYAPAHYYPFYNLAQATELTKSEEVGRTTVSIPLNETHTEEDTDFIIKSIKENQNQ